MAALALHSEITQVLKLLTALKEKTSKGLSDLFAEEPESSLSSSSSAQPSAAFIINMFSL